MAAVVAVALPGKALAWTATLSGTAVCNTTTGKYDVTWTIDNSTENEAFTVSSSNRSAVPVGAIAPAYQSKPFTESLPGSTAGTTTLNIQGGWPSDVGPHSYSAAVTTAGTCTTSGPPPCTSNCTPPPAAPADLGITKVADKSVYNIGDKVTYTLVVTNYGPGYANDVGVEDPGKLAQTGNVSLPATLPTNLDSYAITSTQGTCQLGSNLGTQTARCDLGGIDVGPAHAVTITVTALAVSAGQAVNSACVGSDKTADQNVQANNCATSKVTVNGPPVVTPAPPVTTPTPAPKPQPKPHKPTVHHPVKPHHPKKPHVPAKPHHPKVTTPPATAYTK